MAALGSLVVQLGLNYAQFTGGLDKSEQAALAAGKRIQDTVDGLQRKVAVTAGAIAGGLAAGFTISAFKGLISGAIESSAALHDLSSQTGASVEALSGLVAVGKYSEQTAESIGGAMNKLAANLAGATEESKGTGKALEALGIEFDSFKKLSPDQQMQAVAKAMDGFKDGSGKAAVAMALFGKEGAKMIPFFKDLAEVGELQAKVTTEQAAAADNFDDNLKKTQASADAWKKELALGMIPALDQALTAFMDVTNGTGGFREEIRRLSNDGTIAEWTRNTITGLSYLVDVGAALVVALRMIGKTIAGVVAASVEAFSAIGEAALKAKTGDFRGAWEAIKAGAVGVKSVVLDLGTDIASIWNETLPGERFRESLGKISATAKTVGDEGKGALDFTNVLEKGKKSADGAADAIGAVIERLHGLDKLQAAQTKETVSDLQSQRKRNAISDIEAIEQVAAAEIASLTVSKGLLQQELEIYATKKNGKKDMAATSAKIAEQEEKIGAREKQLNRDLEESYYAVNAAADKRLDARIRDTNALEKQLRQLQFEGTTIGKTAAQVRALDMARTEEMATALEREAVTRRSIDGNDAEAEQLERQAALLRQIAGQNGANAIAQEAASGWKQFTDSLYTGLTDSLYRGFEAGKGFFDSFWNGIKNLFKTTVLKLAVQGVMGGVTGALGLADGGGGAAGGAGSLLSGASSLSGAGGLYAAGSYLVSGATGTMVGAAAGMGATLPGSAVGIGALAGGTGTTGLMGSIGSGLGAMGPVGWIALAALAAYSIFSGSKDERFGSQGSYTPGKGTESNGGPNGALDDFGAVSAGNKATATTIDKILERVGSKDRLSYFAGGFESSKNDNGFSYAGGILSNGKVFGQGTDGMGYMNLRGSMSPEEAQARYANELKQATLEALQSATDIPKAISSKLDGVDVESLDQKALDTLVGVIDKIIAETVAFTAAVQDMPIANLKNIAFDSAAALIEAAGGLQKLTEGTAFVYQNFYSEGERAAAATAQLTRSFADIGLAVPESDAALRQLIATQDLSTQSGRDMVVALGALAPAFVSVANAARASAQQMQSIMANYASEGEQRAFAIEQIRKGLADGGINVSAGQIGSASRDQAWQLYKDQLAAGNLQQADAIKNQLDAFAKLTQGAGPMMGGSGSGGGGGAGASAASSIANAWQAITDSIWGEVKRIRGLLEGGGEAAFAAAQMRFTIATAQARAGDQDAAKALPQLSQSLLALADTNVGTLLELKRIQGQTAASLGVTNASISSKFGTKIPSFDVGTNYVPHDMLAMIHQGEEIKPRAYNPAAGGQRAGGNDAATAEFLRRVADRLDAIEANTRAGAQHGGKAARILERVTPDDDAIQVRETKKRQPEGATA